MARTNPSRRSSSSGNRRTNGISSTPQRDPHPILPPTPDWKKARAASEARKQLKRPRTSIECSSASGQNEKKPYRRILPPRPNYTIPNRQTRSLDPPSRVPQVEDVAPMHNSQPDENRDADTWSPKRLRSRSSQIGQGMYTEPDDSIDGSEESNNDDGSIASEEAMEEKKYDVEGIDGERIAPGVHEYLIRWVGYPERTWTASTDCFCPDLIADMCAVQRADLRAAMFSGREGEAEILQRLSDAAQAKANDDQPRRATKLSQPRSRQNNRPQRVRSQSIADRVERSDSSDDDHDIKSEPDLLRDARANTAWRRLGSAERDHETGSHYTTWYRSKPIDVDALIEIDQRVSRKSNVELVEAWRAGTVSTEMESLQDGWNRHEAAFRQGMIDQETDVDMQHAHENYIQSFGRLPSPLSVDSSSSGHSHRRPTTTIASSTASHTSDGFIKNAEDLASTIARQNSERRAVESELRSISLFVKEAVDMGHGDLAAQAIMGARSHTPIKDEAEEARKLRKRNSERKVQRLLDDASLAAPISPTTRRLYHAPERAFNDFAAGSSVSKKDLRTMREDAARVESIKKINLNTLRRELDSTCPRSVQDVVSHAKVLAIQMSGQSQNHLQQKIHTRSAMSGF
ncbi:hypothetical protein DL98DRAFT_658636 [Cadophora sp. DSE1049]|nr:hypothetical protein DL98DRAFT_658636 [Cadophora sp. DSE1049]